MVDLLETAEVVAAVALVLQVQIMLELLVETVELE
jgi:hypothetical protein